MSSDKKPSKGEIERIRESAFSLEVTTPEDNSGISAMISLDDSLFVVKGKGIYSVTLADQIDPERINISTPNTVQQIFRHGSDDAWVGSVVLTGHELLKENVLVSDIDTSKAMSLVIEIAQNISSAMELSDNMVSEQKCELEKHDLQVKPNRSMTLPSTNGLTNKCKEFIQKSDHALDALFRLVKVFYPDVNHGGWDSVLKAIHDQGLDVDNFEEVLGQLIPFLQFVRNARNCVEHPRTAHKIICNDFSINAGNLLYAPSIEIVHPKTPQAQVPVVDLMAYVTEQLVVAVEIFLVSLCNRHIKEIKGFPVQVHELPEALRKSKNVKFGYGIATDASIIPFG